MNTRDKSGVGVMFDDIAPKYDFLNHFLTLNIDRRWRKKAVNQLSIPPQGIILDVACGTGDLAIQLVQSTDPKQVIGIDISEGMLAVGRKKIEKKGLNHLITLQQANCEALPFPDNTFDAATIGFGIRNFQNSDKGLEELHRVLKEGGELVILEFSKPKIKLLNWFYNLYFRNLLPFIGKLFSKHASAYTYLPESVNQFPYGEAFAHKMRNENFKHVYFQTLTFGIATIYKGTKSKNAPAHEA